MKILLISSNPTIEKLFTLSVEKKGDDVIVGNKDFIPEDNFEAVFIDKEEYNEELMNNLKNKFQNAKFILILSKKDTKLPGFDEYITKPFLPTDLIDFLEKLPAINNKEEKSEFDIENFDNELNLEEDNFNLEDLEKEDIDEFSLDDKKNLDDIEELEDLSDTDDVLIKEDELLENNEDTLSTDEIVSDENKVEFLEKLENNEENVEIKNETDEKNEDILQNLEKTDEEMMENENLEKSDVDEFALDDLDEVVEEEEDLSDLEKDLNGLDNNDVEQLNEIENEENSDDKFSEINEQQKGDEMDNFELENLDETELAKALGEEIELGEENNIELNETDYVKEDQFENTIKENEENENLKDNEDIQSKTLGNILNINWEELKKAKAKVTITIDFGE